MADSTTFTDRLRGNILGGITAAVLSVPTCVGFGMLALAPLGADYIQHGVLAGLYAAVCGGLVSALMSGPRNIVIYAPRGIVTFLISALVAQNLIVIAHMEAAIRDPKILMTLVFMMVFLAGALQILYGLLKFGQFSRYLPAPLLAGFKVAGSMLIFAAQLPVLLGLPANMGLTGLPGHWDVLQPWTFVIGVFTCMVMLLIPKIRPNLPSHIVALVLGTVGFYVLAGLGLRDKLGNLIGAINWSLPTPQYFAQFIDIAMLPQYQSMILPVLTAAASLSVISALDTLLGARLAESRLGLRLNGNRELYTQGLASMMSASFGGIATGINIVASTANQRSGGTGPASILCFVGIILSGVLLPIIEVVPRVVIASLMIATAIQLFDRWTLDMLDKVVRGRAENRAGVAADLAIVAIVAVLAIFVNIGLAVLTGFVITIALFLFRISKSVIRREYTGDTVHSRKMRAPDQMAALAESSKRIVVVELEGPVFFGTSDMLDTRLDELATGNARYIILDLKRVNEMDSSGARVVLSGYTKMQISGKQLLLSSAAVHTDVTGILRDNGVQAAVGSAHWFADADAALEWAEDTLLASDQGSAAQVGDFPLQHFEVLAGISDNELAIMQSALTIRTWSQGEVVIQEGDAGNEFFLIAQGVASVRTHRAGENRSTRLVTFTPGTLFGELAMLDQGTRSATVKADCDLRCYVMSYAQFTQLSADHPALAIKLMSNLGRELSSRLRRANHTIYQLEG